MHAVFSVRMYRDKVLGSASLNQLANCVCERRPVFEVYIAGAFDHYFVSSIRGYV